MRFPSTRIITHCAAQAVLCLLAFNVHAATHESPPALASGTRMTLQATASAEVPLDTVRITLAAETEAQSQAAASQQLAVLLATATKQAQDAAGITSHTGNYGIWPSRDHAGKINGWHGRGEIVLQSRDFAAASALATRMNSDVAISNIVFVLSRQARQAQEHKLVRQVAQAFRARALEAAKAFGFSGYRIAQLDMSGAGAVPPAPHPVPMMRMAAKADEVDAPLQGGNVVVSVSVSGTIVLH
ncbi:SIMPL domain-containing protein [Bordetella sp. FB-8]|uniref:SIMPL domain-containing protein n=1 Tax=Bordetella sp. FB-8 TaxID=1159870 RepID=UPI00037D834D|nr:SIMPL domain-containing protein [Bordetella sp. FB-8]